VTIEIESNEVLIRDHVITDVGIVAEFKSAVDGGKSPEEALDKLLSLGAQVFAIGSSSASTEKLEASVDQARDALRHATKGLEESIASQVAGVVADDGKLIVGINGIIDEFREDIEKLTSAEDSPIRVGVMKSLSEARENIESALVKQGERQRKDLATMLDPKEPTSPLRLLYEKVGQVSDAVEKIREAQSQDVAVVAALETGVFGGLAYEDAAFQVLQRIAAAAGDECESTGALPGRLPRNKKGDAVVDLKVGSNVLSRIVMEAKNKKMTKANWEEECAGSKDNRGSAGFIGLCKHFDHMPTGSRMLILDSTSIVLAYDPEIDDPQQLFLIYHLIRLNCLSATGQIDEINIAEINQNLDEAVRALKGFDSIKKHAVGIRNAANKIVSESDEMADAISRNLEIARNAIVKGLQTETLDAFPIEELSDGSVSIDLA
jgi:hypothetical protein